MSKKYKINNLEIDGAEIRKLVKDNPEILEDKGEFEMGDMYWCLDEFNVVWEWAWKNDDMDNHLLNTGNAFKTEAEAEKKQEQNYALARVEKYIRENDLRLKEVDWNDENQKKWYIFYDHDEKKKFCGGFMYSRNSKELIGELKENADDQIIENCLEDLKIIWGV